MSYLYTASNPYAPLRDNGKRGWYYTRRQGGTSAITCIAVHTAETDPTPRSAEAVARWQRDQAKQPSSYHVIVDSDSTVRLLPDGAVAFHIRDFNTPSLGLSFATRAAWWGNWPVWDDMALKQGAAQAREWVDMYSIPLRWLRKTEAEAGQRGFVRHSVMDPPPRRTDPGIGFPAEDFFDLIRQEDDDMTPEQEAKLDEILRQLTDGDARPRTVKGRVDRTNVAVGKISAKVLPKITEQLDAIARGDTDRAEAIAKELARIFKAGVED